MAHHVPYVFFCVAFVTCFSFVLESDIVSNVHRIVWKLKLGIFYPFHSQFRKFKCRSWRVARFAKISNLFWMLKRYSHSHNIRIASRKKPTSNSHSRALYVGAVVIFHYLTSMFWSGPAVVNCFPIYLKIFIWLLLSSLDKIFLLFDIHFVIWHPCFEVDQLYSIASQYFCPPSNAAGQEESIYRRPQFYFLLWKFTFVLVTFIFDQSDLPLIGWTLIFLVHSIYIQYAPGKK